VHSPPWLFHIKHSVEASGAESYATPNYPLRNKVLVRGHSLCTGLPNCHAHIHPQHTTRGRNVGGCPVRPLRIHTPTAHDPGPQRWWLSNQTATHTYTHSTRPGAATLVAVLSDRYAYIHPQHTTRGRNVGGCPIRSLHTHTPTAHDPGPQRWRLKSFLSFPSVKSCTVLYLTLYKIRRGRHDGVYSQTCTPLYLTQTITHIHTHTHTHTHTHSLIPLCHDGGVTDEFVRE